MLELNDMQVGALEIAFKLADDRGLLLLDLDDLRALLTFVAENRKDISAKLRPGQRAVDRRDPARAAVARPRRRRSVLRRAGARAGRPDPHRSERPRHHQRARRRSAGAEAAAVLELPAVAAVGAVREPARSRRSRQAEARVHLRRSAPAVRRCAAGAAAAGRAGRAPDPVEGRRRVFLLAVSRRRARTRFSGSSATACSTRCGRSRRAIRRPCARPPRRSSPNPKIDVAKVISTLGVGEALVSTLQEGGVPMPVERTMMAPPRCRMGAITAEERAACAPAARSAGSTTRRSIANRRTRCCVARCAAAGATGATGATGAGARRARRAPPSSGRSTVEGGRVSLGNEAAAGDGRNDGQADSPDGREPARPADSPRHPRRDSRFEAHRER